MNNSDHECTNQLALSSYHFKFQSLEDNEMCNTLDTFINKNGTKQRELSKSRWYKRSLRVEYNYLAQSELTANLLIN